MRDFIQANVETNVKQNEELSKRAIPGVTKYLLAQSNSIFDPNLVPGIPRQNNPDPTPGRK
jgi:hypothetical protein